MTEHLPAERKDTISNWSDYIGAVSLKDDLDPRLQNDSGLIVLTTSDELEVCPIFQFDKDEEGMVTINSHIAAAWSLYQSLQITQLDESPFTIVSNLTQPRDEYNGRSWADVLKDPELDDRTRYQIYTSIVGDAEYAAELLGEKLTDPRNNLAQAELDSSFIDYTKFEIIKSVENEYLINTLSDDPSLRLETTSQEDLRRLKIHFIAGMHTHSYEDGWNEAIKKFPVDYAIVEQGVPKGSERLRIDLMENMSMRGIPILVTSPGSKITQKLDPVPDSGDVMMNAVFSVARTDKYPILRTMDLAHDEYPDFERTYENETGLPASSAHTLFFLMNAMRRPLREVVPEYKEAVSKEVGFENLREHRMIEQISIIASNALSRTAGSPVSIAVLHGAAHTPPSHYFSRMGVSIERSFVTDETPKGVKLSFDKMLRARREYKFKNKMNDRIAVAAIVERMVGVTALGLANDADVGKVISTLSDEEIITIQQAWEHRDKVYSRKFSTGFSKSKAQTQLDGRIKVVALNILSANQNAI